MNVDYVVYFKIEKKTLVTELNNLNSNSVYLFSQRFTLATQS